MAFEVSEVIVMTSDSLLLCSSDVLQPFVSPHIYETFSFCTCMVYEELKFPIL